MKFYSKKWQAIILGPIIIGIVWWIGFSKNSNSSLIISSKETNFVNQQSTTSSKELAWQTNARIQIPAWTTNEPFNKQDPRWVEFRRRNETDNKWEWKMPINFYGKVVDENNQPIAGANINFDWNDTSLQGTSYAKIVSGANGLFSLEGKTGRILGVYVDKKGYYRVNQGKQDSFEYSQFFDKRYYIPDPKNPIIFRLRKKGETEPLIIEEKELSFSVSPQATCLIGQQTLTVTLLTNAGAINGPWAVKLEMSNGSLKPTNEEFPFQASEEGYKQSLIIDRDSTKPPLWIGIYQGGVFYVKTPEGYGRIHLRMITGKSWLKIKSYFNSSGSRNLESDEK